MSCMDCVEFGLALEHVSMGNEPWQLRLKRMGMSQKDFAALLGLSANAMSAQLSGKIMGGTSRYVKVAILALERLLPAQRDEILEELRRDEADS